MKRILKIAISAFLTFALSWSPTSSKAQFTEIIDEAVKAVDVAVQKLQNALIDLQNAEKEVENDLSQTQLGNIADWLQKQKDLYGQYFDELWKVKDVITYFKEITGIINAQKQLIAEYQRAYSQIQQDPHFSANEVSYCYNVYTGIINASVKDVDEILTILESFTVQMSDAQRLALIKKATTDIQQQISDLRKFNIQNAQISLQRAKDQADIDFIKKIYGLQ